MNSEFINGSLVVTGIGMVSPVGYSTAQTCAALRAGIAMFSELPGIVDRFGHPIIGASLPDLGPEIPPTEKINFSAWRAMVEACNAAPPEAGSNLVVAIVTAEKDRPGNLLNVEWLMDAILDTWGAKHNVRFYVHASGHAGAASVILELCKDLSQSFYAVIVAADSLLSSETLAYLECGRRLKSPSVPRGVIPGEAAVALVIEPALDAKQFGRKAYCKITGVGVAMEPVPIGRDEACLGEGLSAALSTALERAGWRSQDVSCIHCDLNGEVYRAHEWMLATCRVLTEPFVIHPSDCIGDVGAASLPLSVGAAGVALRRGYAMDDRALVWASSDFGLRGALCIAAT